MYFLATALYLHHSDSLTGCAKPRSSPDDEPCGSGCTPLSSKVVQTSSLGADKAQLQIPDEEVACCTKPGRGMHLVPAGAQLMRTPDYVQVVGFINQSLVDIQSGDTGGELDPRGADMVGF